MRGLKTRLKVVFILVVLSLTFYSDFSFSGTVQFATDFSLHDTEDNLIRLNSYKNKQAVLLFFWTTWCPYCRAQIETLNAQYAELIKDDIVLLGINVGESIYKVKRFLRDHSVLYPVLLDEDTYVAYLYGIIGVPTYILIDKNGRILFRDNYLPELEELRNLNLSN
ncbi:MAG: TlpA family protein disulfide reductase [Candidatus Omnitrophica bacterium]|nr:TlpA family protein disulfide reductase [Candidatus Omnitrophota bacterium]